MGKKIKVIITKFGLDAHNRGAKEVAHALRNAGMEVIYTGSTRTIDQIVSAVEQEDPDVLGVSILSGAHNVLIPKLIKALHEREIDKLPILVGGIIPDKDVVKLKKDGVYEVFGPGSPTSKIIDYIRNIAAKVE